MIGNGRRWVLGWLLFVVLCVSIVIGHVDPCQLICRTVHHDASDEHHGEYSGTHTQSQHLSDTQVTAFTY